MAWLGSDWKETRRKVHVDAMSGSKECTVQLTIPSFLLPSAHPPTNPAHPPPTQTPIKTPTKSSTLFLPSSKLHHHRNAVAPTLPPPPPPPPPNGNLHFETSKTQPLCPIRHRPSTPTPIPNTITTWPACHPNSNPQIPSHTLPDLQSLPLFPFLHS